MNNRHPSSAAFDTRLVLFYIAISAFSLGVALQTSLITLFALVQLVFALVLGPKFGWMVHRYRWPAIVFAVAMIFTTVVTHFSYPAQDPSRFHYGFLAFWVITPAVVSRIGWHHLHRSLLLVSVPGLLFSVYWLLQPAELIHSAQIGFQMYPRASGFSTNPITHSEGLVIIACWSLARLNSALSPRERRLILIHLALSVLIVVFSRVRAGMLGFSVLFLLYGFFTPKFRKISLAALGGLTSLFVLGIFIFGFNTASIKERLTYAQSSIHLFLENPVFGIGPNKFGRLVEGLSPTPFHPHNTLIGMATESGLLGLLAYLGFMGFLAMRLTKMNRKQNPAQGWVVAALSYALALYWVFGFFDYNFADTELLFFHVFHWALIVQLSIHTERQSPSSNSPGKEGLMGLSPAKTESSKI